MNRTIVILVSAMLAGAHVAMADEPGWYSSFNLGLAMPEGSLLNDDSNRGRGPEFDLDDGGVIGLGAGYALGNGLRLEGDLRYRSFDSNGTASNGFGAPSYADGSLASTTLMANLAYDFVLKNTKLQPYLKGGIGAAWNDAEADVVSLNRAPGWGLYSGNTDTEFAWSLGAGVAYPIDDRLSLTAEYQYLDLGSAETGADINGQTMSFDDLGSHEVTLGLRYEF
jgi:outer membrane autotransporter protein